MRISVLPLFLLVFVCAHISAQIPKNTAPKWVKEISYENQEIVENNGGYQYLLIDLQDNLIKQSVFRHYAIKIINSEGVQAMSDINVSYDPSYQKLSFHKIQIVRNGQTIDKLAMANIRTIQRETNMERSLYDGALSTIINLTDVRSGDIIEFAYSVDGFNPINDGNYATHFYHQFASPVNHVHNRLLVAADKKIRYKLFNGATEPKISKKNGQVAYSWDLNSLDIPLYDTNTPGWYDAQRQVSFSTYDSWGDVVSWALPLYTYRPDEFQLDSAEIDGDTQEDKILKAIRLVQDDVRYLGFESGIGAYKPNMPAKVYGQKYGDCKDKSLLLVSLLRKQGVQAFPVLVNTQLQNEIQSQLPSNTIFDHCIVNFAFEGKSYFTDPTISNQGGNLSTMALPNYKSGLLVKNGENALVAITNDRIPELNLHETISMEAVGSSATLAIESSYSGSKADEMRSFFNTNSQDAIKREFLNYYSNLYPQIEMTDDVQFYDSARKGDNVFTVDENYRIPNFWLDSDDKTLQYCQIYPIVLEGSINYPNSAKRQMPYYLGTLHKFSQVTRVNLPEDWVIEPENTSIKGDGFSYEKSIKKLGNAVIVHHDYSLDKEVIDGNELAEFQQKHEAIQNELTYYLTYNKGLSGFKMSWISIVLAILALALGLYGADLIYTRYDPEPYHGATNMTIGGWLVLPAIGLCITPLFSVYGLFDGDFFNHNTWSLFYTSGSDTSTGLILLFGLEIIYNFLFLVFSILIIVLFFQRRTSLPLLISIFYGINFIFPLLDTFMVSILAPGQTNFSDPAIIKDLSRSFIAAIIWIPYFNTAQRVKDTFCRTYLETEVEIGMESIPERVGNLTE
ncbi:MAG TPA: DUF3857 domain-containing protein [Pricia sp.]|nr:DUF3857 domain-containing protein [Pricia sp.]